MLQGNELRIGNKIAYSTHILTVEGLRKNNYVDTVEGVDGYLDEYNGIPLTYELLEQCGFVQANGKQGIFHNKDKFQIALGVNTNSIFYIKTDFGYEYLNGQLFYLHQLQNLYYALTGEELQIAQLTH